MKSTLVANSVAVAAIIMATVLLSGKAEINLQHHLNLPAELANKNTIEVTTPRGFWDNPFNNHRVIHVRLNSEIKNREQLRDVTRVLQEADSNDTVIFHIAGNGGEVDSWLYLFNNIKNTKAHTVSIVESPSYSGHAYLAAQTDELYVQGYSYLMFHTSSAYGHDCAKEKGKDRTVPNSEHCAAMLKNHLYETDKMIESVYFLTENEKKRLKTGHDIYVTAEEYSKRTGSHSTK